MNWLAAALRYAHAGFAVLPVRERAKEPLVDHGVKDAARDEATLRAWAQRWPRANIAIAVPGFFRVLDVDPRNGGDEALVDLVSKHGPLPPTITARTGSGGAHYLFGWPSSVATLGKIGPGLDLLGPGRYFVVAPSIHPNGNRYAWTSKRGTEIAAPPEWLVRLGTRPAIDVTPPPRPPDGSQAFARAAAYMTKVGPAISGSDGSRHTFITASRLVRGFALNDGEALVLMRAWNRTCQPPWSEHDLRRKVREARERGTMPFGALLEDRRAS